MQILYMCFGTHQVVLPDCVGLEKKIDVYLDDEKIELPELQAVVCLNIDSWGAGVHLWGNVYILIKQTLWFFFNNIFFCLNDFSYER